MATKPFTANADPRVGTPGADKFDGLGGDDTISGMSGNDTLIGGLGDDSLNGGVDNDTLIGDKGTDILNGDSGNDSLNGGAENDTLDGGNGNDSLDGGTGADMMTGGDGDDLYWVDNAADKIIEGELGVETVISAVSFTLGANLENLTLLKTGMTDLTGTGNELNNIIIGNAGNNYLDGKAGDDQLHGGPGTADDTLDGGTGKDTLTGGDGNDTYKVTNTNEDIIIETAKDGDQDVVESNVTYELGNYLEMLTLTGTAAINGKGNAVANAITGNDAANTLKGYEGNDTICGNDGDDKIDGGEGNDEIDGGGGYDIAFYQLGQENYTVHKDDEGKWTVEYIGSDSKKDEGKDSIIGVEAFDFAGVKMEIPDHGGELLPTDTTPPVFDSATVSAKTLVLTYSDDNALDDVNKPATTAFKVTAGGVVNAVKTVAVNADAHTVTLTLTRAVTASQAVTITYADPTGGDDDNAIQDVAGNDAAKLVSNIAPANQAPVITPKTYTVSSDTPAGREVARLNTVISDADGKVVKYAITANNTDFDRDGKAAFLLNASTGVLTVNDVNDLALSTSPFALKVQATDDDGATASGTITVKVTAPANKAPVITPTTYTVSSDTPAGREVARLNTVISDADGKVVKYAITANNTDFDRDGKAAFLLNASTGVLTVNDVNDLALSTSPFALKVQATDDDGATASGTITVKVTAPANKAPVITPTTYTVSSDTPAGREVARLNTVISDADGKVVKYAITANNTDFDRDGKAAFLLNASTGVLTVNDVNDLALSTSPFALKVQATDDDGATASGTITVKVTAPANKAPVITPTTYTVSSDTPAGREVARLNTVISDADGKVVKYAITANNTDFDRDGKAAFLLNASTGVLTVNDVNDLALSTSPFALKVQATDDDGATASGTITVNVTAPANKAPSAENDFAETSANTTVQIAVLANDSDPDGDFLTITNISPTENGEVEIVAFEDGKQGISYTPWGSGFTEIISYTIEDGNGGTATAEVTIEVLIPTYALFANTYSVNEGEWATFTVNTTNVADYTMLTYTLSGVDTVDIVDENLDGDYNALTGMTTVIENMATITVALTADEFTDGEDVLTVMLDNGSAANYIVVNDTSITPPATYALFANTYSVNEGEWATFTVNTTNVADYTMLTYTLSGVDTVDIVDENLDGDYNALTGMTTVIENMATITVALTADEFTDGEDVLTVMLDNGSAANYIVVNDTSITPPATYALFANTYSVNEGEWATFTVNTTNVAD
ncbi:SwmB domain-containing protein, partial [Chromatium okenii]|uniref:SwmB domain-containing protein n=1 Tax=Chromatium okenii TaxID=61644 RepID=UPI0026ED0E17